MSNSDAATVVYRAVGRPTMVVDTNGSRLVIHRLNTEAEAIRWGHSIDYNGKIRGIVPGCMIVGDAFVVQEMRDCEDIVVWRGSLEKLRDRYGTRIVELLNSETVSLGVDTGNCKTGQIRVVHEKPTIGRHYWPTNSYVTVDKVVVRNAVYMGGDEEGGESRIGPGLPDPSEFVFSFSRISIIPHENYALVYGSGGSASPPHPHYDSSRRFCINGDVLTTVGALIKANMIAEAVMVVIEALRNINIGDCYGYFRSHFRIESCHTCHRWTTERIECPICQRAVCVDCFGQNEHGCCSRCIRAAEEFELLRGVNDAARGLIEANMFAERDQELAPENLLSPDMQRTRHISMPYEYDNSWLEFRQVYNSINWRRVFDVLNAYIDRHANELLRAQQESLANHIARVGYREVTSQGYHYNVYLPDHTSTSYWEYYD